MARKKKKSGPKLPRVNFSREGTLSGLNIAATALVFGGAVAGVVVGGPALAARFEQQRVSAAVSGAAPAGEAPQILVNWPDWLPHGERRRLAEIAELARQGAGDSPLSVEPLRAIGRSMAQAGWFKSPPRVRRLHGGDIEVQADWLAPAIAVRWPPTATGTVTQRDLVVTRTGRLTPMWYPVDGSGLPVVLSPRVGPPTGPGGSPAFGRQWGDEAVTHAIALLELLQREPYFDQVLGVSCAEYPLSGRLVIVTTWGNDIVWGSAPGVDATHRGEVKESQRLASLRELQQRYTRIDAAQRRLEVFGPAVEIDYSAGRP